MADYSTLDNARLDALELVDRLLKQAIQERRWGCVEIRVQNGLIVTVREETTHRISPPPPLKSPG
jgi:hypothetical protein